MRKVEWRMNRKEIVQKLNEELNVKPKYLGVPSFDYEIATGIETYRIDREGIIRNSKGEEVTLKAILNPSKNVDREIISDYSELEDGFEIEFSFKGHTGTALRNIVNMLASKQKLIMKAFNSDQEFVEESFVESLNEYKIDTIEQFKEAYLKCRPERCPGIEFDFDSQIFVLKLDSHNLDKAKLDAFCNLAVHINEQAKILKHTTFKPTQDENPKYAMRTWLIRLGMNGYEYKASRKTLLEALEGSSAFRTPKGNEKV
jgi:hypothetical protein